MEWLTNKWRAFWSACSTNSDGGDNILGYAGRALVGVVKAPFRILKGIWIFTGDVVMRPIIAVRKAYYCGWIVGRIGKDFFGGINELMLLFWGMMASWIFASMLALWSPAAGAALFLSPLVIYVITGINRLVDNREWYVGWAQWANTRTTTRDGEELRWGGPEPASAEPAVPAPAPASAEPAAPDFILTEAQSGSVLAALVEGVAAEIEKLAKGSEEVPNGRPLARGFRNLEV